MANNMTIHDMIIRGDDALAAAIEAQDPTALEQLLQDGAPVNYFVLHTSKTPLLLAVGPDTVHTMMVMKLLDFGANVQEGESFHGISPLMAACNVQNVEVAELLLQRGANVNAQSVDGKTALIQTARLGNLELFRLLLQWGANLSIYDEQAKNALMYACSENRLTIVRYLMSQPQSGVNDYKVDTALWYASAAGHADVVRLLIEAGALLEYRLEGTIYSTTPLMEACEWGHVNVVELLLQNGAEVKSLTGRKALNLARRSGYHEVVFSMERWEKRLDILCAFLDEGRLAENTVPASLLPLLLAQGGRRPELTHRILRYRMDDLAGRQVRAQEFSLNVN